MDRRGDSGAAGGVLEKEPCRSTGVVGIAGGPSTSGTAGLCWGFSRTDARRKADGRTKRAERAIWDHTVYDAAGGLGDVAFAALGAAGRGDRNACGQSRACGN